MSLRGIYGREVGRLPESAFLNAGSIFIKKQIQALPVAILKLAFCVLLLWTLLRVITSPFIKAQP
jgi:hypothetical protein